MTSGRLALTRWPGRALALDRVFLSIVAIFAALLVGVPDQAARSFEFTVAALIHVAPFLLLSVAIAAYSKASGADNLIASAFHGRTAQMVLFAAAMGALSPFCSCGVIPLIAALLFMGVPLAPVMAFWLASPLMDPSMFVLTAATLGTGFAVAKTVAAFGIGLAGGFAVFALQRRGLFRQPVREGVGDGGCGGSKIRDPKAVVWRFWQEGERRESFAASAWANLGFLGKWLAIAFVIESLMLAYVPAELVAGAVGGDGWLPILTSVVVGVPAYLNGYAALPLVAGLIEQGMAPGAGMAFLLAGGVTSIPAAIAVFALARRPVFFAYLAFALVGSFVAGALYGAL
jgi:uncharacterized membrane protein YraQ (UPF0718 family)